MSNGVKKATAVGHAWPNYTIARTLEALRRQGDRWLPNATRAGDAVVEPLGAIELDLPLLRGGSAS